MSPKAAVADEEKSKDQEEEVKIDKEEGIIDNIVSYFPTSLPVTFLHKI